MVNSSTELSGLEKTCLETIKAHHLEEGPQYDDPKPHTDDTTGEAPQSFAGQTEARQDVILKIECITDRQMKLALWVSHAAFFISLVVLFAEFGVKLETHESTLIHAAQSAGTTNVVLGGMALALLLFTACCWIRRYMQVRSSRKWEGSRRHLTLLVAAELSVQIVNLLAFILPNGAMLADPYYRWQEWLLGFSSLIRWTCWNTLFYLICVHAHSVKPWRPEASGRDEKGSDSLFMDASWSLHWPKVVLWCAMEVPIGISVWLAISTTSVKAGIDPALATSACYNSPGACQFPSGLQVTTALIVAFSGIWFLLWLHLIYRAKRHLLELPYADFKIASLFLRLQERGRFVLIVFFTLSLALLWFVKSSSWFSLAFTWLGLLPCQIQASLNVCVWAYLMSPIHPDQQTPTLQVDLQQFAWTQSQHEKMRSDRDYRQPPPPLFCMQTAFACLYWSGLVYDSHEAEGTEAKMGWGYELLGLEQHQLLWEHRLDTKALLGWGPGGIAIAFRGTASLRNALSDIQVWRTNHLPVRGSRLMWQRPVVHSGFLRCWREDGLHLRVVQRVLALAAAWEADHPGQSVPVLVTGHSLGGALSDLAAYDIVQAAAVSRVKLRLSCYTFGAPRVGNHAYARDHDKIVPDTWSIINDQDVVVRRGKLWVMYKRSGQRVIINTRGDLIVSPSFAEANVQRVPGGGSISQHYLGCYQRALLAVCLAQFSAKRYKEGMQGVMALATAAQPLEALFHQELNLTSADMQELARASEASPEKWSHVRRKRLGARSAKWQDAAAAASLKSSSPCNLARESLISPMSPEGTIVTALQPTGTACTLDAASSSDSSSCNLCKGSACSRHCLAHSMTAEEAASPITNQQPDGLCSSPSVEILVHGSSCSRESLDRLPHSNNASEARREVFSQHQSADDSAAAQRGRAVADLETGTLMHASASKQNNLSSQC